MSATTHTSFVSPETGLAGDVSEVYKVSPDSTMSRKMG